MARVKISEYRAKKILFGDAYRGVQLRSGKMSVPKGRWVAKVDQGVKKRMKQGLVVIDKSESEIRKAIRGWEQRGFSRFLLEPLLPHAQSEEQYFSLERVRDGVRMLHAKDGGVDIEEHSQVVESHLIRNGNEIGSIAKKSGIPENFLTSVYDAFEKNFFAFLEINPLVVQSGAAHALDAAVLVDSAGEFFVRNAWGEEDIMADTSKHEAEKAVALLAATTPASLRLTVLNTDGALFFLLSGGGGSIVIADEAQLRGVGGLIANYGEYSGGPTREETYLYAKEILKLLLASRSKKKALVIAGGVANFTDVKSTFLGIIDALAEVAPLLRRGNVRVYVRRGGPNEKAGLALMNEFLKNEKLLGIVVGSDEVITKAVDEAISYVSA
jgi:succinyl-CoA synthetase beta subunit